jgi:hypothetical protein
VNAAGVGYTRLPPSPDGQDSTSGGGSGATFSLVWNPGGGPFGQGDNITGGNGSLRWKFLYPATVAAAQAAQWVPSTAYAVGAVVGSVGNLYYCFTAGTSSASGSLGNGPSGQSTDITDGTVHWSYIQPGYVIPCVFGICEGQIYGVSGAWQDNFAELPSITSLPHPGTQIQLDLGTSGGWTRPAWIPTPDPTLADLYPNTALLSLVFLSNGGDGSLPNLSLEVAGIFCDATHSDVSAADIATDILTHSRRGVAWPSARVDSVSTGAGASSWRTYCTAYGLNLSFLLDSQTAPLQILGNLLLATNTDAVWTNRADGLGGMLKFVPRCDTALTANGVTFTPPGLANVPGQYGTGQLGPDDVLEIPKSTRRSPTDCLNSFPIEFVDRTQDYRLSTVDDPDMADVDQRGLMRASTTTLSGIVLQPQSAVMLSRIFAQRSLKVRNTWTLKLSFRHMLLEPTDVITYRDDVIGRTTTLRVIAADEQNMDGSITFTCEEWSSAGIHVAAQVTPQGQASNVQAGAGNGRRDVRGAAAGGAAAGGDGEGAHDERLRESVAECDGTNGSRRLARRSRTTGRIRSSITSTMPASGMDWRRRVVAVSERMDGCRRRDHAGGIYEGPFRDGASPRRGAQYQSARRARAHHDLPITRRQPTDGDSLLCRRS